MKKNRNSDRRSEEKGSIKDEVIREHHPVEPQADRERGQGNEALEIFTAICIGLAFLGL